MHVRLVRVRCTLSALDCASSTFNKKWVSSRIRSACLPEPLSTSLLTSRRYPDWILNVWIGHRTELLLYPAPPRAPLLLLPSARVRPYIPYLQHHIHHQHHHAIRRRLLYQSISTPVQSQSGLARPLQCSSVVAN